MARFLSLLVQFSLLGTVFPKINDECKKHYGKEIEEMLTKFKALPSPFRDLPGAPFCVDKNTEGLKGFEDLLSYGENIKDDMIKPLTDDFEFTPHRILVPDQSMYNLRNWAHLMINPKDASIKIKVMLMQAISSPLGIPFGEFRTDIGGMDIGDYKRVDMIGTTVPCKYRPKAAVRNPNVFVLPDPQPEADYNMIHVSFNWIDVTCHEVISLQFIILAQLTTTSDNLRLYFSPVFYLTKKDYAVGVPFPFYYYWIGRASLHSESLTCDSTDCRGSSPKHENLRWDKAADGLRILYNKEYYDCIRKDVGLDKTNAACPPGPFYCAESREKAAADNKNMKVPVPGIATESTIIDYRTAMTKSWAACPFGKEDCPAVFIEALEKRCNSVFPQSSSRTADAEFESGTIKYRSISGSSTPKTWMPDTEFAHAHLKNLSIEQRTIDRSEHGALMIAAYFVVISGSNFLVRFFKETGGASEETQNGCCGYRCWLLVHMTLSFMSLYLVWMSLAMPLDTLHCQAYGDVYNLKECVENPNRSVLIHSYFGYVIVLITHINFIFGWIRPLNRKYRNLFTAIHSITGHIIQFLALAAIPSTKVCKDIFGFTITMVVVNIVISGVATFLQWKRDKTVALTPSRKLFPIAEHVQEQDCKIGFIVQLWIHWIIHIVFYMLILFGYKMVIKPMLPGKKCWLS